MCLWHFLYGNTWALICVFLLLSHILFIFCNLIVSQVIKQIAEKVYLLCSHLTSFRSVLSSLTPQCVQTPDTALFLGTSFSGCGQYVGSVFSLESPCHWFHSAGVGWRHMTEHDILISTYVLCNVF